MEFCMLLRLDDSMNLTFFLSHLISNHWSERNLGDFIFLKSFFLIKKRKCIYIYIYVYIYKDIIGLH